MTDFIEKETDLMTDKDFLWGLMSEMREEAVDPAESQFVLITTILELISYLVKPPIAANQIPCKGIEFNAKGIIDTIEQALDIARDRFLEDD